jgi:hypothetical protein
MTFDGILKKSHKELTLNNPTEDFGDKDLLEAR